MGIEVSTYARKPFTVEAVKVTENNLDEVAAWCNGQAVKDAKPHVKLKDVHTREEKNTRAFPGSWILKSAQGYRIYGEKAFHACFTKADVEPKKPHLSVV